MSNSITCGIVGLPNVGKSTLFNAITDNDVLAANYPFATIEPNTGVVAVPDERLNKLAELYHSQKVIPAQVTFVDIAGLVAGASTGEGLGNQFLGHIRTVNAIVQVVRAFTDPNVSQAQADSTPQKDIDIINTELVLADLQTVNRRLPVIEKLARTDAKLQPLLAFMQKIKTELEANRPLFSWLDPEKLELGEQTLLAELQLLTAKPVIYLFNVDETTLADNSRRSELGQLVEPSLSLFICAKLESELRSLDQNDRQELLGSYGQSESGLNQLIHAAYEVLGLQSFLTAGEKEVRAWTIKKGSTAPEAAGVIHSDFERGFIAAEIVSYSDLIQYGSLQQARAAGKVRTEGKSYVMQPDDVVEFRFNV